MSNQGWHAIRPRIGALTASAFSPPAEGGGGGTVTAPAATTEDLPDTDTPTAKTFGAFTDTEGLIDNYVSTIVDIVGTTTASGSGLGPYTYSGAGPGTAFVHLLTARDASNNPLATAAHGVDIMPSPPSAVTAPAATSESVASGGSPANKTFSAFTDPDGLIDNYVSAIVNISGTTTASGSGLGPWSYSGTSDGTAFVQTLTARDASNNPLATAVHGVQVASPGGDYAYVQKTSLDLTGLDTAGPWSSGTQNIQKAAATVIQAAVSRSGTTNGVVETGSGGVRVYASSGTGQISCAFALDTLLSTDDAYFTAGLVVLQIGITIDTATIVPGSGAYMLVGVSNLTGQGQSSAGIIFNHSLGNVSAAVFYDSVTGSVQYTGAYPSEALITIEIFGGRAARVRLDVGTDTPVAPSLNLANVFPGQPVFASNTAQPYGTQFHALISNKANADMRVTALRVDRLEAV